MPFEVTPAHADIFDAINSKSDNIQVEAVAGSGKTSTLVEATRQLQGVGTKGNTALFCAFSKAIQVELQERLPRRVLSRTLNSLGLKTWTKYLKDEGVGGFVDVESRKSWKIWQEMGSQGVYPGAHRRATKAVLKLAGIAKTQGIVIDDDPRQGLLPDTNETWQRLIEHFGVQLPRNLGNIDNAGDIESIIIDHTRMLLRASMEWLTRIDFDDMLWFPFIFNAQGQRFDRLFVDECQDLSPLNHDLVKRTIAPGGQLIAVGDKYQSIFGFRGADVESIDNLALTFNTRSLPLHVSYRCPRSVVALAQTIVPHIQARDGAEEGLVEPVPVDAQKAIQGKLIKTGDYIVSRTNAPAIGVAQRLLKARIPVEVLGRDLAADLKSLVEGVGYDELQKTYRGLGEYLGALEDYEAEMLNHARETNWSSSRVEMFKDKVATVRTLSEGVAGPESVLQIIDKLFEKPRGEAVRVSSIHKAKGLEAERVWILNPDLLPHPSAEQDWEIEQERNLHYVAVTRAKRELRYLTHR